MRLGWLIQIVVLVLVILAGCGTSVRTEPIHFLTDETIPVRVEGMDGCGRNGPGVYVDPRKPLVILVHGCNSSSGRFRTLAGVFEAHGQQVICFTYDDRDSLEVSSAELARAVESLSHQMENRNLTILGHSQGGLITRRALVMNRPDGVAPPSGFDFRVVTVSSPFNGIAASSHCSLIGLHLVSLGVSAIVCRAISGDKWSEIHGEASFMRKPGDLTHGVSDYIKVVTDERDSCRTYNEDNECVEDDFVFSVAEQYNPGVDGDRRTRNVEVRAGHAEIVGKPGVPPLKLLQILQKQGVLSPLPSRERARVAKRVAELYGAI